MIVSYHDARTTRFAGGERVKQFEPFRHQAENRLFRLETATSFAEPAALRGNRKGQWSIRINDQWRICFRWAEGALGPNDVEIVDHH